ncbi:hypothetical protein GPJ56_007693 [Histomonas meleagridis]|uniref:uncharacterized protein n=1 Tax=Histomonas meleagridis TaxID=135588 RepID=UPI003559B310|nr:hypothetical protein GPJ56_007693 [Histomonas meleagridis]KAH0805886.1 hypothetical protein GO595_001320 [Histomonas meleagridis]
MQSFPSIHNKKRSIQQKASKPKQLPSILDVSDSSSNEVYKAAIENPKMVFFPQTLHFLPTNCWTNSEITFGELITKFFQRKNNSNCRFPHKLYNALVIVECNPSMWFLVGVRWITDTIFKVDKYIFGRLLGITSIDGGLFHCQGNFASHGFVELSYDEVRQMQEKSINLSDIDMDRLRLMKHKKGTFTKNSKEEEIAKCKWME